MTKTIPTREGVGRYDTFCVTEEVFRPIGKGKMLCLTTGEVVDRKEFERRGKGTSLKVTDYLYDH
jgi:hypothetical protein